MSRDTGLDLIQGLVRPAKTKIVLLVLDGLGGLPIEPGGGTALETAHTPNLDELAKESVCGLHEPVGPGITPGSGPAHLALFGYDPLRFRTGRGVLSALGIGFDLQEGDVAARGNFCTVDDSGQVTDRRAGRIDSAKGRELCSLLSEIQIEGAELFVEPVKEYRFVVVFRGRDLSSAIADTDPQQAGREPRKPEAQTPEACDTGRLVEQFLERAQQKLAGHHPADMVLLRGFSSRPDWPSFQEAFGLRGAALADYPMYRGAGRLLGMNALHCEDSLESKISAAKRHWDDFDFFYLHVKQTDSAGEDGDGEKKRHLIEEADRQVPSLREMAPDVLIVTGDHSTPAVMKAHSWHPVPTLLWSESVRRDCVAVFGERNCIKGELGPRCPATDLLPLALAHAGRLRKFGA